MIKILLIIVSILWISCIYAQCETYEKASDTEMTITTSLPPKVETINIAQLKRDKAQNEAGIANLQSANAEIDRLIAEAEKLGIKDVAQEIVTPIEEIIPE